MNMLRVLLPVLLVQMLNASCAQQPDTDLGKEMNAASEAHFSADAPGAAILVTRNGQVLYERAIGLADVATKQVLDIGSVFRIGSVTKQFTAVAILQLADAGKVDLNDEIQEYVDFPRKEHPITIEHLLTHTSGIPNYTDLPSFREETYAKDISVTDMIALFSDLPLEFEPGTQWNYCNSGYILLGAVIERASGTSWDTYLSRQVFDPLGMQHTSASVQNTLLPGEVNGHVLADTAYAMRPPMNMTWPYAAGTIRSTVHDLRIWNQAVFAGKVIPEKWMEKAHTDHPLADGSQTHYGYGWQFLNVQGRRTIEHGGGIDGFVSTSLYVPEEEIHVVVLSNRESSDASALASELAAIALGEPYGGPVAALEAKAAEEYIGVYTNTEGVERYITADEQGLHSQRQGSTVRDLDHLGNDRFIVHGDVVTVTFQRTAGRVTGATLRTRRGEEQLTRTDKPLPVFKEVLLNAEALQKYAGVFELSGGMRLAFRAEGQRLFVTATRQPEIEVFAEAADRFFLKEVDARIEFHPDADGGVRRMTLIQGGELSGVRIE